MKTVSCKIPEETFDRLQELADRSDRKVSYLLREAVTHYMDEYENYLVAAAILAKEGKKFSIAELKEQFDAAQGNETDSV